MIGDVSWEVVVVLQSHSLTMRRAVQGRSKSFNDLLGEHKAAKEAQLLLKAKTMEAAAAVTSPLGVGSPLTSLTTSLAFSSGSSSLNSSALLAVMSSPTQVGTPLTASTCSPMASVARSPHLTSPGFSKILPPSSPWQKPSQVNLTPMFVKSQL